MERCKGQNIGDRPGLYVQNWRTQKGTLFPGWGDKERTATKSRRNSEKSEVNKKFMPETRLLGVKSCGNSSRQRNKQGKREGEIVSRKRQRKKERD